jgi:molybdopterin synthase sulfur carrier subunit
MKAIYFAWIRECVGKAEEEFAPPAEVVTVAELIAWLSRQGDGYACAFDKVAVVRAAIDRRHDRLDASVGGAREIAFFPPMTGG